MGLESFHRGLKVVRSPKNERFTKNENFFGEKKTSREPSPYAKMIQGLGIFL